MAKRRQQFECPNCGAEFRAGKLACPECGSDAQTGWKSSEDIDYESVEIPDYLTEDASPGRRPSLVVVVLVIVLVLVLIGLIT